MLAKASLLIDPGQRCPPSFAAAMLRYETSLLILVNSDKMDS